jgi:hypothetical protein
MYTIDNPICTGCNTDVLQYGHAGSCPEIKAERGVVAPRTARLSPEGAPKVSTTWRTPRRRPSAVVTRKLRKNGQDIDRRFKPVVS